MADGRRLPTGTVTFCFTDIEGSTRLLAELGDDYSSLLEAHAAILRQAIAANDGTEVSTEGDAFFAAFHTPADAVAATVAAQLELAAHPWQSGASVRVRMGLHTGTAHLGGDNYVGMDVHRAARIAAAGHGGQVLLSAATRELVSGQLPPGVTVRDLGEHRLRDLEEPEHLHQLVIPGLEADFPPVRARRAGNVPEPATSFVGREQVVTAIRGLLAESRLVTLTGPGGAGKTRLSLRVASELADEMQDGAWFVPLDVIREAKLVPGAIADTLELRVAEDGPMAALRRYLAERELLLVMDNFEQVLAAAEPVDELLKVANRLRVLVTSRAALRLYGEQEYAVPPLTAPDPAHLPPLEGLSQYEAVALFVARARAVRPDFAVTSQNAPAVAELSARLDGLPLAIELAAARVKLLTPDAILKRLATRLDLLSGSAANLPPRQRTLRGAIAWSWELLDEPERRVLERLSVFAGGCGLDAAERVTRADQECGIDLLSALESLVDKSLVRQSEVHGEPRFTQLETIREYGLERLAERDESDEIHGRLAAFAVETVEAAEPFLNRGPDDEGWFDRLATEYDNVRAALRWSVDSGELASAQRIVAAIWRYWQRRGQLEEGAWWTDEVLRVATDPTPLHAGALRASGSVAYWREDYAAARDAYEQALDIYRSAGDEAGIAWASYDYGFAYLVVMETEQALVHFHAAHNAFRQLGDVNGIAEALFTLGYTELIVGDLDAAESLFRESLELEGQDSIRRGDNMLGLAQVARRRGDHDAARSVLRDAIRLTGDRLDLGNTIGFLEVLGAIEVSAGEADLGMRLWGAARRMREQIGGGPPRSMLMADPADEARATIGSEGVERAVAAGRALTKEAAVALALGEGGAPNA